MKVKELDIKLQKLVINQYKKGISVNEIAKNELSLLVVPTQL